MNQPNVSQTDRGTLLASARELLNAGKLAQAEQVCKQLLDGGGNDVDAIVMLSMIAQQQGAMDRSEALLQRCAKLQPKNASHPTNLGKVRVATGQFRKAIESFDKALRIHPTFEPAVAGKADALNQLGEVDEALAVVEAWTKANQSGPDLALVHATLLNQAGRHEDAIRVAKPQVDSPQANAVQRVRLGLLLGQCQEALRNYEPAFEAYRRANELRARSSSYNPQKTRTITQRLIELFSSDRLSSFKRSTLASERPVFIVGMARSGTSLIEQIISAHPQAYGAGELTTIDEIIAEQSRRSPETPYPDWLAQANQDTVDDMCRTYLQKLERLAPQAQRVVNKYLRNHQHLGLIWMLFPSARVIHCRRNALDTCFSCYTSALSPMMHGYCSDLHQLGEYHALFERIMSHWRQVLDLAVLEVHYEQLVAQPEKITREIISFCGLEWDERCLRAHEVKRAVRTLSYDQVRRPIYSHSVNRARHFEPHLQPLMAALSSSSVTAVS